MTFGVSGISPVLYTCNADKTYQSSDKTIAIWMPVHLLRLEDMNVAPCKEKYRTTFALFNQAAYEARTSIAVLSSGFTYKWRYAS